MKFSECKQTRVTILDFIPDQAVSVKKWTCLCRDNWPVCTLGPGDLKFPRASVVVIWLAQPAEVCLPGNNLKLEKLGFEALFFLFLNLEKTSFYENIWVISIFHKIIIKYFG